MAPRRESGDANRGGEPITERLGGVEASDPGEHCGQDRHPEGCAELPQHIKCTGRLADLVGGHRADDGVLRGGYDH